MSKISDLLSQIIDASPELKEELKSALMEEALVTGAAEASTKTQKEKVARKKVAKKTATKQKKKAVKKKPVVEKPKSSIILPGEEPVQQQVRFDNGEFTTTKNADKVGTQIRGLQLGKKPEFYDDQSNQKYIKENAKIKAKWAPPDRRAPTHKVQVRCHVCSRTEMVSPALMPPRYGKDDVGLYRCNNCR